MQVLVLKPPIINIFVLTLTTLKVSILSCFQLKTSKTLWIRSASPVCLLPLIDFVTPPSLDHLKARLDNYVQQLNIVRVLRQRERKGLITARLMGAQAAQGEVLTFLDSHCV